MTNGIARLANYKKREALMVQGKSYREIENAYRMANREEIRLGIMRRKYGLTRIEHKSLLEKQNHACAICARNFLVNDKCRASIDHDHSTGKVRGILCSNCNTALGLIGDNPKIAQAMIKYLNTDGLAALDQLKDGMA